MYETNRIITAVVLSIASIFIAASPSFGALITYTEHAIASGSLNGIPFMDETVVLSMDSSTTNVTTDGPGLFFNEGTVTLSIGGGSAVTFTNATHVFSDQGPPAAVGFEDVSSSDVILDTASASFATYDLTSTIGPVVGSGVINPGFSFPTSGGAFVLTSVGDFYLYRRDIGNSRAVHFGHDADRLRRPRVRGYRRAKGGPRNSRRLAYRPSPGSRAGHDTSSRKVAGLPI